MNRITELCRVLTNEQIAWNTILCDRMERLTELMEEPNGMEYKAVIHEAINAQKNVTACEMLLKGWT